MRFKILAIMLLLSSLIINLTYHQANNNSFSYTAETKGNIILGHKANPKEINNFSNLVPNYQYFTKLNHEKTFGYTDLADDPNSTDTGICEYISLTTLLTYYELFVSSGFFSNQEWNKYFETEDNFNRPTMPTHKNYKKKNKSSTYNKTLSYDLYKLNNSKMNIFFGHDISKTLKNFLENKDIAPKIKSDCSVSWWHTSSPEDYLLKYNVPVMVSFTKSGGHNVVIYGYDKKTNSYLVHYGWPGCQAVIIKKTDIWSLWSFGFWNAFYIEEKDKTSSRKAFNYQSKMYSWDELAKLDVGWNQIK